MKLLFILLFITTSCLVHAQKFEFGKVSEKEIQEKQHPTDPEATAAVLFKKSTITFEFDYQWKYVQEVEVRLKIYKKEGFDKATIEIPLYRPKAGENEIFSGFRAFTYNLDGNKIVKDKLNSENQFQDDMGDDRILEKFTFPNIKEGSVIEYKYKVTSPYISSTPTFYFQEDIPVNFAEYSLVSPEFLGYKFYTKGFVPLERKDAQDKSLLIIRQSPTVRDRKAALVSIKTEEILYETKVAITTFTAKNVPKFADEVYINNIQNYVTSIKSELEWIKSLNREEEIEKEKKYSQTWDDVVKTIFEDDRFGKELKEKNYFEAEIAPIIAKTTTNQEKAIAIFEFLKNKISWNGSYGKFTKEGVKNAYKNRTGNAAEINLILTAMFKHARLNANPILMGTKDFGIPLFPTIDGFNYVISGVRIDGQLFLFDATSKYSTPNVLPERALNWFGQQISEYQKTEEIDLMPSKPSRSITNLEVNIVEGGIIKGKLRNTMTDHLALEFREEDASISDAEYVEKIQNKYINFKVKDFSFQNKKDLYKPLIESYDFEKTNAFDQIGDKIFIQPTFFLIPSSNPFTNETRNYPIDFKFPRQQTYLININIPEGYKVESMPESEIFQFAEGQGEFNYIITNTPNNIQLRINSNINAAMVAAESYDSLKSFYEAKVNKLTEKITLTKIK